MSGRRPHAMKARSPLRLLVCTSICLPAWAADPPEGRQIAPVVIDAPPLPVDTPWERRPGVLLKDNALRERNASTLGETVSEEAGVHSASFGTAVGIPVIRGLTGARVKVLNNGSGTHDASSLSPDHASTGETVLAESVRILRGPATIRYGGGAIGGVVDIADQRIPTAPPVRSPGGALESRYNSNGHEVQHALKIDAGNSAFALHAQTYTRNRGDSRIPGCAVDVEAIAAQFGPVRARNSCASLYNSDASAHGASVGGTAFVGNASFGAAAQVAANQYGIPPLVGHSHGGDDRVRIAMDNARIDTRAEWLGDTGWLQALRYTSSDINYRHDEIDGGRIATTFKSRVFEQRGELEYRSDERFSGTLGYQYLERRFSALGLESFIPLTDTRMSAVYAIQRATLRDVAFEFGWRNESTRYEAGEQHTSNGTIAHEPRSFQSNSWSAGATWRATSFLELELLVSAAQRAPEIQELYATGPHLATRTYDIGNNALQRERMSGRDLSVRIDTGAWQGNLTLFSNEADDFIFQRNMGVFYDTESQGLTFNCIRIEQCLPLSAYTQAQARFRGLEGELAYRWQWPGHGDITGSIFGDAVRGRLTDLGEDIPRLPPYRAGIQLAWREAPWSARLRLTRVGAQDRPGANETPTEGHVLLNAWLSYDHPLPEARQLSLYLKGRNLLDREIRNATSFLRSFSPEPGRAIEAGLVFRF